jgi:hypothetical protein
MARWILGYTMFVLGIFWVGWDIVGPGPLLWGLSATCLICSVAGGLLWWQDERRWRQEALPAESPAMVSDSHEWSTTSSI